MVRQIAVFTPRPQERGIYAVYDPAPAQVRVLQEASLLPVSQPALQAAKSLRPTVRGTISLITPLSVGLLALLLSGCGGSSSSSATASSGGDQRSVAVQAALDAKPPVATVYAGFACQTYGSYPQGDPKRYIGIPGAHVGPVVKRPLFEGAVPTSQIKPGGPTKSCREVTWDTSAGVKQSSVGSAYGLAKLGRYVLDKLGDDAQQMGGTYAPFRAHFEPSVTGTALIDAHIVHAPTQNREGSMFMSKDADGHVKAQ